jgi:hypothetical protein
MICWAGDGFALCFIVVVACHGVRVWFCRRLVHNVQHDSGGVRNGLREHYMAFLCETNFW